MKEEEESKEKDEMICISCVRLCIIEGPQLDYSAFCSLQGDCPW